MSSEWIDIIAAADLEPGDSHYLDIGDLCVAVFNLDGQFFAVEDICSHHGVRMLSSGVGARFVHHGDRLMCPRHGAEFCIRTGAALSPPACEPIKTLKLRIEDGRVELQAPAIE